MTDGHVELNPFEDGSALRLLRGLPPFEEALARLLHLAEHGRPCGIVRGPAGVGKSTLLEFVSSEFRRSGVESGQIDLRRIDSSEFPWKLACELGVAPSTTEASPCWRLVEDALLGRAVASRLTILLIDHLETADALLARNMERLMALASAASGWCTILGAGRLDSPTVDQLVTEHSELRIELPVLEAGETDEFLRRVAEETGCVPFDRGARRAIHQRTQGLVREIVRLGRLAHLARVVDNAAVVSEEMVTMVAGELTGDSGAQRTDAIAVTDSPDENDFAAV